jgi:hypothetical protein
VKSIKPDHQEPLMGTREQEGIGTIILRFVFFLVIAIGILVLAWRV